MIVNLQKSKEEISEEKKATAWQGKIASARIDASQGAIMFQVLGFIVMFAGIPMAVLGNLTLIIPAGFALGFLFLGISYILQALEVIIYKLYDQPKGEGSENAEQN